MFDNNEVVFSKNLTIEYSLDDETIYTKIFIVDCKEMSQIVLDTISLLDRFKLTSWSVHSSKEYQNIKENCASSEYIIEYLINDIDSRVVRKL